MKLSFLLPFIFLLAGCSMFQPKPTMDAEQLAAAAKDKNASVACGTGTGPWGKVGTVFVNVDKASINSGSVTVDSECKITISAEQKK